MTTSDEILACLRDSLAVVTAPRFFETERGYQGELAARLRHRGFLPDPAILEQEHQKLRRVHGLAIRPDLIIHEPYDPVRHPNRTHGNLAAMELKLRAKPRDATKAFKSLAAMIQMLNYPLGVFINIDSDLTYEDCAPEDAGGRIVSFAVALRNGIVQVIERPVWEPSNSRC